MMHATTATPAPADGRSRLRKIILFPLVLPGALLTLLLFALAALISLPIAGGDYLIVKILEARLRRRLQRAGRFLAWTTVTGHLAQGTGTLIIESAQKSGSRFWWTPDDIAALAPCPPPSVESLDYLSLHPPHAFVAWCQTHYTSPSRGSAFITTPRHLTVPPGFIEPHHVTALFPHARVICSVLPRHAD